MSINQARQQRRVAQVDDLGSLWMFDGRTNFHDAILLHQHFAGSDYFPVLDIEEARGVQNDGVFGGRWCGLREHQR